MAPTTITDVISAITTIAGAITFSADGQGYTGIALAQDGWPAGAFNVDTQLPAIIVEDGAATYRVVNRIHRWNEVRQFPMHLVYQIEKKASPNFDWSVRQDMRDLLRLIVATFMQNDRLSNTNSVIDAQIINDTGPGNITHASQSFHGATIVLSVSIQHQRSNQ